MRVYRGNVATVSINTGFEDFYAGWAPETPPGFTVSPIQGRMERRGGEPSVFDIEVQSDGAISASRRVLVVSLC